MSKFDTHVYLELRQDLRELTKVLQSQLGTIGLQLGTWLVLGNAAGIYFLSNAVTNHQIALDARFSHTYLTFLIGATLAFAAICWSYFISIPMMGTLSQIGADTLQLYHHDQLEHELEQKGAKAPADWEAMDRIAVGRMEQAKSRMRKMWAAFGVGIGIYVLSAICFLVGLATPLLGGLTLLPRS
jgi:hypothetical protein